jgi:hypothetical protein
VLAPSSVTELNLKQRFDRHASRMRFGEEAARAGEPVPVAEFRPLPNTRVVARRQGQWWSALVVGSDEDECTIRFTSDGLEQEIGPVDLVPEPVSGGAPPARGVFVLMRPNSPSDAWQRVRVLGSVDSEVRVETRDGNERKIALRDVLALAPR